MKTKMKVSIDNTHGFVGIEVDQLVTKVKQSCNIQNASLFFPYFITEVNNQSMTPTAV
jgi:hypothetical protein